MVYPLWFLFTDKENFEGLIFGQFKSSKRQSKLFFLSLGFTFVLFWLLTLLPFVFLDSLVYSYGLTWLWFDGFDGYLQNSSN